MQTAYSSNILVPIYQLVHSITSQKTIILTLQLFLPFFIVCDMFYVHDSMTFWKFALLSSLDKYSSTYWQTRCLLIRIEYCYSIGIWGSVLITTTILKIKTIKYLSVLGESLPQNWKQRQIQYIYWSSNICQVINTNVAQSFGALHL